MKQMERALAFKKRSGSLNMAPEDACLVVGWRIRTWEINDQCTSGRGKREPILLKGWRAESFREMVMSYIHSSLRSRKNGALPSAFGGGAVGGVA